MMTKEFEALSPYDRGYAVYACGCRDDYPNIPDEKNPYPPESMEARQWYAGNTQAMLDTMDTEE